jgi:hypothetical protein
MAIAMAIAIAIAMAMATDMATAMATAMATPTGKGINTPTHLPSTYFQITLNVDPVSQEYFYPPYEGAWLTKLINPYCCNHHDQ